MLSQMPPRRRLDVDDITADCLKAIRESSGMNQLDFAKSLGLSERAYRNYERGSRSLPQGIRCSVLEHYGDDPVSTAALLDMIGRNAEVRAANQGDQTALTWAEVRTAHMNDLAARYTGTKRKIITVRDNLFMAGGIYGIIWTIFFDAELAFDTLDPVRAGLLVASFVVCATTAVWIVSDLPFRRTACYLRRKKWLC